MEHKLELQVTGHQHRMDHLQKHTGLDLVLKSAFPLSKMEVGQFVVYVLSKVLLIPSWTLEHKSLDYES